MAEHPTRYVTVRDAEAQAAPCEHPFGFLVKAILAGIAGTVVIDYTMGEIRKWTARRAEPVPAAVLAERRAAAGAPPAEAAPVRQAPGAREQLADRLAHAMFGQHLTEDEQRMAATAIHWIFGTFWGIAYAYAQSILRVPVMRAGALFGIIVWLVGNGYLLPRMRLAPAFNTVPLSRLAIGAVTHIIYGITVAVTLRFLSRFGG